MNTFDHERLDVYQVAIDFVALADEVVEHLPRGRRYLADQLQRAAQYRRGSRRVQPKREETLLSNGPAIGYRVRRDS